MKKINCLLLSLGLTLGFGALSSCSFIGEDPYSISHITYDYDEEGNTLATIHYTESAETPSVTIKINKGKDGETGNGIKEITSFHDEKGEKLIINVSYTDPNKESTTITVPVKNGKDGAGIKDLLVEKSEETGDTKITINYTDDRQPTSLVIPKGDKGDKGDSITNMFVEYDPISRDTIVTVKIENNDDLVFTIPAGQNGISILEIKVIEETDTQVTFEILFDDLNTTILTVQKSRATKWYSSIVAPEDAGSIVADSMPGDFYFNSKTGEISIKQEDGSWKFVFEYEGHAPGEDKRDRIKVNFDLNGGTLVDTSDSLTYKITEGTVFSVPIPLAKKEGCEFLGWYTDKVINALSGKLAINTPIVKNPLTSDGSWTYYAQYKTL